MNTPRRGRLQKNSIQPGKPDRTLFHIDNAAEITPVSRHEFILPPHYLARRTFLGGASAAALATMLPGITLAAAPTDKRFVLIILRGGMDGMNVVVPYGDHDYARLRGPIAIAPPGEANGVIDLDGFFGLHPALAGIAPWYREGALLPIHAVALPYRDRSHYDGQDMLMDGWLNRALGVDERPMALSVAAAEAAGKMLADANGPRVAVFDAQGWDTHAGQKDRLAAALGGLAASLTALRAALGPAWKDTVVMMATEFGRTAHANGAGGTDHGTGAATLLAGGAVAGGKVLGQWPGLAEGKLYQGRDLMPTTDLRAVMKTVLREHLKLPQDRLESVVFPNSADARPIAGITASA